jgi:N-acetylmuramoyl-L-alanine amidase
MDEPLFGETYRQLNLKSSELAGTIWYLIGGHGGQDMGAKAKYRGRFIYEDEIAYDTMLRFGRLLRENGATVYFVSQDDDGIRDDVYLDPDVDERFLDGSYVGQGRRKRLKTRTDQINRESRKHSGYQRVVEFHVDNYAASRQFDVSFFYWSIPGQHLAETLRETLRRNYAQYRPGRGFNGHMRKEPFHTLKYARPVVAYIELGNIQNSVDQERLVNPEKRQTIAEWLYEGFLKDVRKHRR